MGELGKQIEDFILVELKKGAMQRSTIAERVSVSIPGVNPHTVQGAISRLSGANKITQVERGVWALPGLNEPEETISPVTTTAKRPREEAFYASFADWLLERGECSIAMPLGKNVLQDKWMTPDVIGVDEVPNSSIYRRSEIVAFISAEVKVATNPIDIIQGFGQACSYLHFSHKSILVIPNTVRDKVKVRMDSLCRILGLGLVYFDADNADDPDYRIKLQAIPREPDVVAINDILSQKGVYDLLHKSSRK